MRELSPPQRQALGLFVRSKIVTAGEMAEYLGISPRQAREWCAKWAEEGFMVVVNPSKKARIYGLGAWFEDGLI